MNENKTKIPLKELQFQNKTNRIYDVTYKKIRGNLAFNVTSFIPEKEHFTVCNLDGSKKEV